MANGQFFDITLTSVFSHTSHHSTQCWQFSTQQRSSWKIIIMRMTSGLASSCVAFSSDISGRSHAMLLLLEKYNMAAIERRRLFLYGRDGQHGLVFTDMNPSDHLFSNKFNLFLSFHKKIWIYFTTTVQCIVID